MCVVSVESIVVKAKFACTVSVATSNWKEGKCSQASVSTVPCGTALELDNSVNLEDDCTVDVQGPIRIGQLVAPGVIAFTQLASDHDCPGRRHLEHHR